MKRLSWLVVILVCTAHSTRAQQGLQAYVVTGTGAQARIVLTGSAIVFHQLTWNVTGTVSSCTVALDTSTDGVSWSAGNAITGQTCTSNGQSALSTSAVFNFVRVNTTAFSGTGSVVVTWAGYVATPGGLPSGCTSPGTGAITCTNNVLGANLPPALPTTPNGVSFIDTSTPAGGIGVAPAWSWPGVPVNAQTGASYTIAYTDRGQCVTRTNAGAITDTIPDGGTTNFANSFYTCIINIGATTDTLSRTTSSTINGGTSISILTNQAAYIYLDALNNWRAVIVPTNGGGGVTTTGSPVSGQGTFMSGASSITSSANWLYAAASGHSLVQGANGADAFFMNRFTDTAPTGNFLHFQNAAKNTDLFTVNASGGLGGITDSSHLLRQSGTGSNFFGLKSGGGSVAHFWFLEDSSNNIGIDSNVYIFTEYNNILTTGNGIPAEYATLIDLTSQTVAITPTTVYAAPATGFYRVCFSADITTAGTTSVLGGAAGFAVIYTSPTDSVVKTTTLDPGTTSSGNTTGTAVDGCKTVYAKTGTNIQYSFGYASTGTTMVYEIHVREESF